MKHDFYNLEEAAKEMNCEVIDLLKLGAEGKIELHVWYQGMDYWDNALCPLSRPEELLIPISKDDVFRLYHENDHSFSQSVICNMATLTYKNFPMHVPGPFTLNTRTLFLPHETLETIKAQFLKNFAEPATSSLEEDEKSKKTNLHIIGALLEIIMDKQVFETETKLRQYIAKQYIGFMGCSESTLAKRFKQAKDLLSD